MDFQYDTKRISNKRKRKQIGFYKNGNLLLLKWHFQVGENTDHKMGEYFQIYMSDNGLYLENTYL